MDTALQQTIELPDYLVKYGSHLYGNFTPESDQDYRGFVIPPNKYLLDSPFCKFEQSTLPWDNSPDTVIWSFNKFFKMLMKGDPQAFEILHAPESHIVKCSNVGEIMRANKNLFLSMGIHYRIFGYSQSEWRKVRGVSLEPIIRTVDENQIIDDIRNVFSPDATHMNEVIKLLFNDHERTAKSSTRKLGKKRKEQIEKYGYCIKSACNTIRLLDQLVELHTTHNITFPRHNCNLLKDIKLGKYSYEDCEVMFNDLKEKVQSLELKCLLPKKCDNKKIENLYFEILNSLEFGIKT